MNGYHNAPQITARFLVETLTDLKFPEMTLTPMMTLTDDTTIYEWCFEFYSPKEEEWVDYGYWTISDDQSAAIELLMQDEDNEVEHLSCNLNTWTYAQFKQNQGENSLELIRDL